MSQQRRLIRRAGIRAARTEREASVGGNTDQVNPEFTWDEECFIEFDERWRDRDLSVLTSMTPGTSENLTTKEQRVIAVHNNDQDKSEEEPEVAIIKSTEEKRLERKRQRNQRRHKEQKEKRRFFKKLAQPTPIDKQRLISIRIDFPSVEKRELEKPKDKSLVGIREIQQSHNCGDIIAPQPLRTIRVEGYRLIPIDMPNQLDEARRNGRFFVDPRDPRGFRYHTPLDSYKRKRTEMDDFVSEEEREREYQVDQEIEEMTNRKEEERMQREAQEMNEKLSEELIKGKIQRLEKKEQERMREKEEEKMKIKQKPSTSKIEITRISTGNRIIGGVEVDVLDLETPCEDL